MFPHHNLTYAQLILGVIKAFFRNQSFSVYLEKCYKQITHLVRALHSYCKN